MEREVGFVGGFTPVVGSKSQGFANNTLCKSPTRAPAALTQNHAASVRMNVSGAKYLTEEALEKAQKGSKHEKMKLEKCGSAMWTEIHELQTILREGTTDFDKLNTDDIETRLKWAGLFHRKKRTPKRFMMRLKVPNGVLNSTQMRYFAEATAPYGEEGCIDVTTRMNIQLRGIQLTEAGDVVAKLQELGVSSLQSGMDSVRNMVGSPIAGLDPHEIIDTRPLCYAINEMLTEGGKGRAEIANLPRKFNIAVSGSRDDFAHTHINDIGLVPIANPDRDGEIGFNVVIGGFFSIKRNEEAIPMDVWLPVDEVVEFCNAALLYFRDHGDRKNRQAARLMYMIDQWGVEGFRDAVASYMPGRETPLLRAVKPGPEYDTPWPRRDITGVHEQKQPGLSWVCANVPAGRITTDEMATLADLADKYSGGEMRLTVEQNILFPNVRNEDVDALLAEPLLQERFRVRPGVFTRGLVSCTGAQFCGFALIETKNRAIELARLLDERVQVDRPIRMHWTGCKNSCGQAQVADIGLMGGPAKNKDGKATEGVDIFVGGQIGESAELGQIAAKGVPCDFDELVPKVEEILVERFGATIMA